MPHSYELAPSSLASIPWKNAHMHGCVLLLLRDTARLNVCLIPCPMCEFGPSHSSGQRANPIIGCIGPLFFPLLSFVWPQSIRVPLLLSYQLPWHNTLCCLQSVGRILFPWFWGVESCWVGGVLVPPCQISLAQVSMGKSASSCPLHVHILAISFWCCLALKCQQCAQHNPRWVWYCTTSCRSNLWWVCTLY